MVTNCDKSRIPHKFSTVHVFSREEQRRKKEREKERKIVLLRTNYLTYIKYEMKRNFFSLVETV